MHDSLKAEFLLLLINIHPLLFVCFCHSGLNIRFVHYPPFQYWLALYKYKVMIWPQLGVVTFVFCMDKVKNGVASASLIILS